MTAHDKTRTASQQAPALVPFSHRIPVASISRTGQHVVLNPSPEICQTIAEALDLPSLAKIEARFLVVPSRSGIYTVTGRVKASVEQRCIVTLEPFAKEIDEEVDISFAEPDKLERPVKTEVERTLDDVDPPEPVVDGVIDCGALAVEFVALGLDPFPRKPGAELPAQADSLAGDNPFAALAALKKPATP